METIPTKKQRIPSPKDWALIIFITGLPLIGIIMLLVWAFDENTDIYKKNYAKGSLILMLIIFGIFLSFLFLFGGMALISNLFD